MAKLIYAFSSSIQLQQSPRLDRRTGSVQVLSNGHISSTSTPNYGSPRTGGGGGNVVVTPPIMVPDQSPRQKAFLDELVQRRSKIVQVMYDRVAQNPKELTVARGEYLEVGFIIGFQFFYHCVIRY